MPRQEVWLRGLAVDLVVLAAGLNDIKGLLQPKWFYDSMT